MESQSGCLPQDTRGLLCHPKTQKIMVPAPLVFLPGVLFIYSLEVFFLEAKADVSVQFMLYMNKGN